MGVSSELSLERRSTEDLQEQQMAVQLVNQATSRTAAVIFKDRIFRRTRRQTFVLDLRIFSVEKGQKKKSWLL